MSEITQEEIIMEYFEKNQNRDIPHPEIVDWATAEYKKRTGKVFRDPDRQIRKLFQDGKLLKITKGVYRYDKELIQEKSREEFTPTQKAEIFKRDNYRCVICGNGPREGFELHADHIKPREQGGKATLDNGQTLCSKHNMLKKTWNQTETGKQYFKVLYKQAKKAKNQELMDFCLDIFAVYEDWKMNSHIKWEK